MRIRHIIGWCFVGFFALLGVAIYFVLYGYSFTAYLCFGAALLLSGYQLLGMLAARNRKLAKLLRLCLSTLLGFLFLLALGTGLQIRKTAYTQPAAQSDYVLVLGAGLRDNKPSTILQERLEAAEVYLNENPQAICVVTGGMGAGESITEAQCMFDWLVARGISQDRIWMETAATSTYENVAFSVELIRERTGQAPEELSIISSEFHLFRAGRVARDLGLEPQLVPATTENTGLFLNYFLREIPAVWAYLVFGG